MERSEYVYVCAYLKVVENVGHLREINHLKKDGLVVTQQTSTRDHYDLGLFHLVIYLLLTRDLKPDSLLKDRYRAPLNVKKY